ncbi:hypothetical protein KIN20_024103 [Parelaphostrongylus tenuis]|uniref:Uncharacterized protein n=1 Tax=Parelaphostrongylus tenuis TaxID=148309 RepID=A0AAD5N9R5_PARTN|nr:hypothetical protein KIN20_024103 [Parelaphostrongylus tenuis]
MIKEKNTVLLSRDKREECARRVEVLTISSKEVPNVENALLSRRRSFRIEKTHPKDKVEALLRGKLEHANQLREEWCKAGAKRFRKEREEKALKNIITEKSEQFSFRPTIHEIAGKSDRTVGESTDRERFREFKAGNEELADETISGQTSELGDEDLISGLENEPSSSSRELAAEPVVYHTSVLIHLHQLDFVPRTKDRIHTYRSTSKQVCLNLPSLVAKYVE